MAQNTIQETERLTWGQRIGFALVGLTLVLIPVKLNWAIWGGSALLLYSLVMFIMGGCKLPKEGRREKLLIGGAFVLYFVWHLVAMLWTGDVEEGWASISRKWFFVTVPTAFLIADWSWLKGARLRQLLYLLLCSLVALFVVRFGIGAYKCLFQEASWHSMLFVTLDPVHHNYMSLYLLFGIAFAYSELMREPQRWTRHLGLTLCILLLAVFLVLKNSRGGLLTFGVMAVVYWCDLVLRRRYWKLGAMLLVVGAGLLVGAKTIIPESQQRIESTVNTLSEGKGDIRLKIYGASLRCIAERPLLGHGTGNVNPAVKAQFDAVGQGDDDKEAHLNCHDIYLQSWVAGGVMGFVFLMGLLGVPLLVAYRQRNPLLAMLVLIYAVSGVVESLFERQMAILFYCLLCGVLTQAYGNVNTDQGPNLLG